MQIGDMPGPGEMGGDEYSSGGGFTGEYHGMTFSQLK